MMSEMSFNIDNGYLEGLVRGFKGGILKQTDYLNLVQCETLEGEVQAKKPSKLSFDLSILCQDSRQVSSNLAWTSPISVNLIEI